MIINLLINNNINIAKQNKILKLFKTLKLIQINKKRNLLSKIWAYKVYKKEDRQIKVKWSQNKLTINNKTNKWD